MPIPEKHKAHFEALFKEDLAAFEASIEKKPTVSVRNNPAKGRLGHFQGEPVPWQDQALWLPERPSFALDPIHHAGGYYVQEASSMFFASGIDFSKDMLALDLCAAPGGKSTLLLSQLSQGSLLVSNELDLDRNRVLVENLTRWGAPNVAVTNNKVQDFDDMEGAFDLVVVDAPCSGEGMFRKDSRTLEQWSPSFVEKCSQVQAEILPLAANLVSEGGYLAYSTCTFEPAENERQLEALFAAKPEVWEPVSIPYGNDWGITERKIKTASGKDFPVYYFYLHHAKGEGQFISLLRKQKESVVSGFRKKLQPCTKSERQLAADFTDLPDSWELSKHDDRLYATPKAYSAQLAQLKSSKVLWKLGVRVGSIKKNGLVPDHELAMSPLLAESIPRLSLDLENALAYLRKQPFSVETNAPKGWAVVEYDSLVLGWVKNLGNRFNNYYPKEWKLRMGA